MLTSSLVRAPRGVPCAGSSGLQGEPRASGAAEAASCKRAPELMYPSWLWQWHRQTGRRRAPRALQEGNQCSTRCHQIPGAVTRWHSMAWHAVVSVKPGIEEIQKVVGQWSFLTSCLLPQGLWPPDFRHIVEVALTTSMLPLALQPAGRWCKLPVACDAVWLASDISGSRGPFR